LQKNKKSGMIKGFVLSVILLITIESVNAQSTVVTTIKGEITRTIKKDPDTLKWNWKQGGLFSLNLSQGSLSNWASGGDNFSLAIGSYFNYFFYYKKDRQSWDNNFDFNLGYVQTTSLGSRKNDDRIDFLSKYGYKMDSTGKWYLSGLFNFRTQMFDGYTYASGTADFSSTILSPAYVVLSAGFDYKPSEKFSLFLSPLTARWVIVENDYLANLGKYGVDTGKHSIAQLGMFATINYNNNFAKNITYKGRADLFSNYLNNPQNINIFMSNQLSCKINRYFSFSYSLDLIYDDNIRLFGSQGTSPGLQVKSLLGLGFLAPLNIKRKIAMQPPPQPPISKQPNI
jgi:hypothetical protein